MGWSCVTGIAIRIPSPGSTSEASGGVFLGKALSMGRGAVQMFSLPCKGADRRAPIERPEGVAIAPQAIGWHWR